MIKYKCINSNIVNIIEDYQKEIKGSYLIEKILKTKKEYYDPII